MATVRELIAAVRFRVDRQSMIRAERSVSTVSRSLQSMLTRFRASTATAFVPLRRELARVRADAQTTGRTMATSFSLPLALFTGFAIKAASDFELAMNRVKAVSGATESQFKALTDQAKMLGETTQFSATEAAQGMGFLAQAGLSVDEIARGIGPSLNLAAAGNIELAQAADIATNVMTGYGKSVEDLGEIMDSLAKIQSISNTNITEAGEAAAYAAGTAASAGMKFRDFNVIIGGLANSGVKASRAGTTLASALARVSKATDPTTRGAKLIRDGFDKAGISIESFVSKSGKVEDFIGLLREFAKRGTRMSTIMQIFGMEAGRSIAALTNNIAALDKVDEQFINVEGSAQRAAETMMRGLPGTLKLLKSSFEAFQIAIVETIKPALIPFIDAISSLMKGFNKLQPEMKVIIAALLGFVGVIGPAILVVGLFKTAFLSLIGAITAFKISALAIPALIIGVIAIIGLAIDDLFGFMKGRPSLLGELVRQSGGDAEKIRAILLTIASDFEFFFDKVTEGWSRIFSGQIIDDMLESVDNLVSGVQIRLSNMLPSSIANLLGLDDFKFPSFDVGSAQRISGTAQVSANQLAPSTNNSSSMMTIAPSISVSVSNSNASPEAIGAAVSEAIGPSLQKTVRQLRQQSEPLYEN